MTSDHRHESIAAGIFQILKENAVDDPLINEMRIVDYPETDAPQTGIIISMAGDGESMGTNERDDIIYVTRVTRITHALAEGDRVNKSKFRSYMRKLFHHKRLQFDNDCHLVTYLTFGEFASPRAWKSSNFSASTVTVNAIVRETRT